MVATAHLMVRVGGDGGVVLILSASHVASVLVPTNQSANVEIECESESQSESEGKSESKSKNRTKSRCEGEVEGEWGEKEGWRE